MKRPAEVALVMDTIAEWQRNAYTGTETTETKHWRDRLARIAAEAQLRQAAQDWDWFRWLDTWGVMRAEAAHEYHQIYSAQIATGGKVLRGKQKAIVAAAATNLARGAKTRKEFVAESSKSKLPAHNISAVAAKNIGISPRRGRQIKKEISAR